MGLIAPTFHVYATGPLLAPKPSTGSFSGDLLTENMADRVMHNEKLLRNLQAQLKELFDNIEVGLAGMRKITVCVMIWRG